MTTPLILPLLLGPATFRFDGGTVFELAKKLDNGTGVVISVNSNLKVKAFEFKYSDQKDFDRLLAVKSGLRRLGPGGYAARGYPLHVTEPPRFRSQGGPMRQVFAWDSEWPFEEVGEKWKVTNKKDEPLRLGRFPLAGKSLKMPPFFERLEVVVTSGTYEPKSLATKIAAALGGKLRAAGGGFEISPNLAEVRRRFRETFDEKLASVKPTDVKSQYNIATIEFSREMFGVAPDSAIEKLLDNENSSDFTIPKYANLLTAVRNRAIAYSKLPGYATLSPSMPLQPANFLQAADWDRPAMASLYSWPLKAGLIVWVKDKNEQMAF